MDSFISVTHGAAVVREMHRLEVDSFAVTIGVHPEDLPEFHQWCRLDDNQSALKRAQEGQRYMRSMVGYLDLVQAYQKSK